MIEAKDAPEGPRIAVVAGLERIHGSQAFCLQDCIMLACVYILLKSLYSRQLLALIYDVHEVSTAIKWRRNNGRSVVFRRVRWLVGV